VASLSRELCRDPAKERRREANQYGEGEGGQFVFFSGECMDWCGMHFIREFFAFGQSFLVFGDGLFWFWRGLWEE